MQSRRWLAVDAFRGLMMCALGAGCSALAGAGQTPASPDARAQVAGVSAIVMADVAEIAAPGVPGPLVVFAESAVVLARGLDARVAHPLAAAGQLGVGRVVAFGHTGYLSPEALDVADTRLMLRQAINWVGRRRATEQRPLRIGTLSTPLAESLRANQPSWMVRVLEGGDWAAALHDVDVLCIQPSDLSTAQVEAIRRFVRAGGGLIAADLGWGWLQLHPGRTLLDHPGNLLLREAGIAWADGTLDRTSEQGFDTRRAPEPATHAAAALRVLERVDHADPPDIALRVQATGVLTRAVRTLSLDEPLLMARVRRMQREHQRALLPSEQNPLRLRDGLGRVLMALDSAELQQLAPAKVQAHPAHRDFPGAVPSGAARVRRQIKLARQAGWQSTGLYAPAGEVIEVVLPQDASAAGLSLRIGCHSDELWHLAEWKRFPQISHGWPLQQGATQVASAFGGLIYIEDETPGQGGVGAQVEIRGAVEAPRFLLGTTTAEEWRASRRAAAPWAELESSKIVLTVPSAVVRELEDPASLMQFWDRVADSAATLAGIPLERTRAERYVADVQISAGYMHAGYPIMTHLDAGPVMVDVRALSTNSHGAVWGLFHELGHNHQSPDWTFEGTGEVTVNLFTLYALESVCGIPPVKTGRAGGGVVAEHYRKLLAAQRSFETWKADPFLALQMYVQLQEAFGWDAYREVFLTYRALPDGARPRRDADKRDQWLVRMSHQVGHDLGPFFEAWGVPTSEAARAMVRHLPAWMPAGFPPGAQP